MPDKGNLGAVIQSFTRSSHAQYREGVGTIPASGGDVGGGSESLLAYRKSKRAQTASDDETWVDDGLANTLNGFDTGDTRTTHAVAHAFYSTGGTHGVNQTRELCPPLKIGSALGIPSPPAVCTSTIVRRLTPVECDRLQGFPDGWTDIGTPEKPTADSHRYRQLGNAVTVNVAEWLAKRAHEALIKEAR
jgi:site-specific DNA-cytosine methylase